MVLRQQISNLPRDFGKLVTCRHNSSSRIRLQQHVALIGGIAYRTYRAEQKRTEELQLLAQELGFGFAPQGDSDFLESLNKFHLCSQGHSQRLWNLMRGTSNNLDVAVFDYRYVTGSGKHRRTWNHSVIRFQFQGPTLPTFSLRPENVWHKIGSWFGYQDIDFESHARFSKLYLLRGGDENAVRTLFTDRLLDFYEQKPGLCTEGWGNTLLYYQHSVRLDPQGIRSFMYDGFKVLALYRPA